MNKLTAIRIKYDDGTYSDEIPVSTLAEYILWDDSHNLVDILGNIDMSKGTVQAQLNDKLDDEELANYVQEQISSDVTSWLNTHVTPAGSAVVVDTSLTISGAAADAKKTGDEISELNERLDNEGLSEDTKVALLDCFAHVAWIDAHGQDYYDALEDALYPETGLVSISAVFTQGSTVIYPSTPLNDLKAYLVVTGHYNNGTSEIITDYSLSGTLETGSSTVTVSKEGKTDTFTVTVSPQFTPFNNYVLGTIALTKDEIIIDTTNATCATNTYVSLIAGNKVGFNNNSLYEIYKFAIAPRSGDNVNWNAPGGTQGWASSGDFDITVTSDKYYSIIRRLDSANLTNNDIELINSSFGLKS